MSAPQAQIRAVFEESSVHFKVFADIPLENLCILLTTFGRGHGEPLFVEVSLPPIPAER